MARLNLLLQLTLIASSIQAFEFFDRNLAYSSPFADAPQVCDDIIRVDPLHEHTLRRRQTIDSSGFTDGHYATFYGSKLGNSPFIWAGGVNFTHSGIVGDPLDSSVLLWTRAIPTSSSGAQPDQSVPVCVAYQVSKDASFSGRLADSGEAFTSYDVDFTVKVEAKNLKADTKYFYRFSDCATKAASPVGTTRTIAHPSTPAHEVNGGKPLVMAVFSCSQYQAGWFNAYGYAAHNTSADLFLHLGDYIYESLGNGAKIGRQTLGRELATIHDYRQRLNQYRTDASLALAHQQAAWITVWYDDHEVADNSWKAGTADSNDTAAGCSFSPSGACFTDRKLAAVRAYHEWMPIRQVDPKDELRIWRNFQIGQLLDLTMLDTRQYERDLTDVYYNTDVNTISSFPNRSLMGLEQEQWLYDTLSESKRRGATWRIIGQQIVFTQLNEGGECECCEIYSNDAWDGYRANRARVLDHLYSNKISNTIILSGDSHANWVSDLAHPNDTTTYKPSTGEGAIGVEFAGTAVTSSSAFGSGITPAKADIQSTELVKVNADLQWSEGSYRGFFTLSIDPNQVNATYYAMRNITFANLDGFASAQFNVKKGANKLTRPVAGGSVLAGVLKSQATAQTPLGN
ncbi:PhoD-like phosphatase-domain-containing protein [Panaeolus papilionaceus]|nr:PhoD-like phosphatase-domain-containing protein [Panaeolus papilionaceus]